MQAAENAITDKYASAMINNNSHHRNYLTSSNETGESGANMVGGISGMTAMSQSYRNVGSSHAVNNGPTNKSGIYDKLRNSYQSPNQYVSSEMMSGGSFHNPKASPKVGG